MKIYELVLLIVRLVFGLARKVESRDKDVARQMRRACASIALNLAEGLYSRAGNQVARFHDAMGSARETMACLHVCVAAGYLTEAQVVLELEHLDHAIAVLYRLCHKRRG